MTYAFVTRLKYKVYKPVPMAHAFVPASLQYCTKQIRNRHARPSARLSVLMLMSYASSIPFCLLDVHQVNADLHAKIESAGSLKGGEVAKNAANDALCKQALDIFFTAYASEAGNALLKWLPTGGFYLTGGIAAKNIDRFGPDSGVWQARVCCIV